MRTQRIYGRLATEGIEAAAVAPGEETPVEPVEAGADSLEAELVEVNTDIVDLSQAEAQTDDAVEVAEELEVAAEALHDIARNGGLDRNGARILNLYTASLNKRLGLPANHKTVSIESFGGTNSRPETTKLSAEGFADKAKELWGKIVEMFRSALSAIAAVWNRIFDGATRMKARAESLLKGADGAKGDAAQTFENQKLATGLHINGVVDAVKAADAINKEASVLGLIAKHATATAEAAIKAIEAGGADAIKGVLNSARSMHDGFAKVSDAASVGVDAPGEGLELWKSEALPGNKAIIAAVPTEGAKPDAIGKAGFKVGIFDASKKVADKVQLKTLSSEEIKNVAKKVGDAADLLIGYKGAQKEAEATAKKVIALAEAKAKETPKEGEKPAEGALTSNDARSIARGSMTLVVNSAPPIAGVLLNAGGYALQYAEQSLKLYGKKAADKKPDAPAAAAPAAAAA